MRRACSRLHYVEAHPCTLAAAAAFMAGTITEACEFHYRLQKRVKVPGGAGAVIFAVAAAPRARVGKIRSKEKYEELSQQWLLLLLLLLLLLQRAAAIPCAH